jgi:hypothetical protein
MKKKAPSVGRKWKRFFGVSCSHAKMVDRSAWAAMLKAKKAFDPHFCFHLGDFIDTTGWRSGAKGADLADDYRGDISTGLTHLGQLEPQLVLCGNHEARLWRELSNPDGRIAGLASDLIQHIRKHVVKGKAEFVEYNGIFQARQLGNFLLTHGSIFNVNACRDMAETYGNIIFGHTHTAGSQMGRHISRPQGINIGTLTDSGNMDYAHGRRQTFAWRQAWVYGDYCADELVPILHIHKNESQEFKIQKAARA